jgi:hypothetical protein
LPVSFELNGILNPEVKKKTEDVIRACIGARPEEEVWKIWIHSFSGCFRVVLKAPIQTRDRTFFEDGRALPQKVREWLESYPLR